MIFSLIIVAIFIGASIYFFFRAESLQRALLIANRESSSAKKNQKVLQEALALTARKGEEFAKFRLEKVKGEDGDETMITLITPLINNYAIIYTECLKGKGHLKGITKKCLDTYDAKAFNSFVQHLKTQEKHIQRMWSSDNLNGFMSLIEALLLACENKGDEKLSPPKKKA